MAIRVNKDGSITVGILPEEKKKREKIEVDFTVNAEEIVADDGIVIEEAPKIEKKPTRRKK